MRTKSKVYRNVNKTFNFLGIMGGGSDSIYSLTEEECGEWINGKPIYRIVFPLGTITDATATLNTQNNVYATTNTIENVETVVGGFLIGTLDDLSAPYMSPVHIFIKNSYVYFSSFMALTTTQNSNYIVVEYTKTTDTVTTNS